MKVISDEVAQDLSWVERDEVVTRDRPDRFELVDLCMRLHRLGYVDFGGRDVAGYMRFDFTPLGRMALLCWRAVKTMEMCNA